MKEKPKQKYYWGIGLENETYMQFEESMIVSGGFIQEKIGCERYSIDYRKCYKSGILASVLENGLTKDHNYRVSRMINSHSLDKIDLNYQHKTIASTNPAADNPEYLGKSILENFLETQPYNIQSMLTQKTNPMGSVNFDGDSIEFVTRYFENRTIPDSCDELAATKKLFIDKINESGVLNGHLHFPNYNIGFNMFVSNQENIVLFNNGTYHFHMTLPTLTENSRIVDYAGFEAKHANAIYLLQWFEPLFIATLGSPDIMQVISSKHGLNHQFAGGSMRNAMSRYTGVGTFNKVMAKGKILTYQVEEFRKLLRFEKEENIWWRDQVESDFDYELLSDIGLDFNQEKMYQSGFEFRSFDEFPASYLPDLLHAIIIVCEHSLHVPDVPWCHDSVVWNNLVFKSLKFGYQTEITSEEKQEVLEVLNLSALQSEFDAITMLDAFFFRIIEVLHEKYKDHNTCIDSMLGDKPKTVPKWDNFNQYQVEQHLKQIEGVE
nr:hypothetical protein [uncultured Fluviicola sp.]